jgi:hypothetical protein
MHALSKSLVGLPPSKLRWSWVEHESLGSIHRPPGQIAAIGTGSWSALALRVLLSTDGFQRDSMPGWLGCGFNVQVSVRLL